MSGGDQLVGQLIGEAPSVLLAQLELDLQTMRRGLTNDLSRREPRVGEPFAALDPGDAHLGAQLEIDG